jgi:TolB-like protein/Tfp pilus assembly protein PilF
MASFFEELRRRNVFKVGIAYLALTWLLMQVADLVLTAFGADRGVMQALIVVFAVGFPIVVAAAWAYELTPDGVIRSEDVPEQSSLPQRTGRKLDFVIIAFLSLALITVVIDQYIIEASPFPEVSTLAVLPLANLSGDPDQEYFADGITAALITNLAKVTALRVVSRTSIMRFKGTDRSLPAIAAELGVDVIVEGSAVRDGDRIRITAQLIDAATDQHLWAESFDRDYQDVLKVQGEIATSIAKEIRIAVTPEETARLAQAAEVSADGYDAYLKGMQHFYRLTPQDLETALQYFDLSLEQNPDAPLAHAGVAAAWVGLQQMGFVPSSEAAPKSEAAALRALELDADNVEAHVWLGVIRAWVDWDWDAAEDLFLRAIELNPSSGDARIPYSHMLALFGRFDEAMVHSEHALKVDPFNAWFIGVSGVEMHMAGRHDEAIATFHEALRISPDLPFVWLILAGSHHVSGQFDKAIEAEGSLMAALGDAESQRLLQQKYDEEGYENAMSWYADLWAERSAASGSLAWWVAYRYVRSGQDEKAIEWLEQAYEQRDPNLPFFEVPEFENLRTDPRVRELMRRVGVI